MADMKFDGVDGGFGVPQNGRINRMVNLAGAVCSVALIAGLAVWGYKLAVRDVNGIPVFRALAGPLRVAPDNPGGDVMAHQGLSVNAIASAGVALPLPDSLTLAPKSADLAVEDVAGLVAASAPAELPLAIAAVIADAPQIALHDSATGLIVDAPVDSTDIAATAPLAAEPMPQTQADAVELALAAALADEPVAMADMPEAGSQTTLVLAKSVRPRLRPTAPDAATPDVSDVQQVAAVAVLEIDPATIAAGTRLVQLGAFDDEPGARAEWAKLQGSFAELIVGKAMVVQAAQSGGRTFYRLRAHGFVGEDEARRFCAALLAENASCIPVAQR